MIFGDLFISALALAALYALAGCGFSLSFNVGGFFDLSLGTSFLIGGYAALLFVDSFRAPLLAAMLLGVLVAGLTSAVMGFCLVIPLSRRVSSLSLFVATLATLYIAQATVGILFGEAAHVLRSGAAPVVTLGPVRATDMQVAEIVTSVIVLGALVTARRSRWGRYAQAVADDSSLAAMYGIPVYAALFRCYVVAGVLAGLAGVFYVGDRALEPVQAMTVLLAAMVATIVGGESISGAIYGAMLLALMETVVGFWAPGAWKGTVAFSILIVFLALKKGGIVAVAERKL